MVLASIAAEGRDWPLSSGRPASIPLPRSASASASCRSVCPIRASLGPDHRSLHPPRSPNPHSARHRRVRTLSRVPSLEASVRRPPCARMRMRWADIRNPSQKRPSKDTDDQTACGFRARNSTKRRPNLIAPQLNWRTPRQRMDRSWGIIEHCRASPPHAETGRG